MTFKRVNPDDNSLEECSMRELRKGDVFGMWDPDGKFEGIFVAVSDPKPPSLTACLPPKSSYTTWSIDTEDYTVQIPRPFILPEDSEE